MASGARIAWSRLTLTALASLAACGGPRAPASPPSASPEQSSARAASTNGAALPDWAFPKVERVRLANGLGVARFERGGPGSSEVRLVVRSGSGSDGNRPGVAALTAQWLKAGGTASASSRELVERIETLGAQLGVATGFDATILSLAAPDEHFEEALALLAKVAREPRFLGSEFEKLKEREIERVSSQAHGDTAWIAQMALYAELFRTNAGRHPYAQPDSRPADLATLEPADGRAWYATHFSPQNAFLLASGAIPLDRLKAAAEAAFGTWQGDPVPPPTFATIRPQRARKISLLNKPGSPVSELRIGALGAERTSPRWPALRVASQILGGAANGRLGVDVRRAPSFAYATSTALDELAHGPTPFVLAATIPARKTGPALAVLFERLQTMVDGAPTREELSASTRELEGAALLALDTNESAADLVSQLGILMLADDYPAQYRADLRSTSVADVRAAATDYLSHVQATIVVGDAALLVTPLSHFGQVDVIAPESNFRVERVVTRDPTAIIELPDAAPSNAARTPIE